MDKRHIAPVIRLKIPTNYNLIRQTYMGCLCNAQLNMPDADSLFGGLSLR